MKLAEIPYNVSFHFDEELRDVPDDPDGMEKAVDFLLTASRHADLEDAELVSIYGWLGVFCRMLGDLTPARRFTLQAIALADEIGDKQASIQNHIRLANVLQWQGDFTAADLMYESLVLQCGLEEDLQQYLDFALQHFGKSLFDQGRYREAAGMFQQALDLRLAGGKEDLITSARHALGVTLRRLESIE